MIDSISLFKLLSDETRLAIVLLLVKEEELCVCEFIEALELSQPKISRHLAMLREAELLSTRREGKWIHYSLSADLPLLIADILAKALLLDESKLAVYEQKLQAMGDRPERKNQCC